ncbi:hypothetical protein ACFWWS_38970, partial [Streptomyces sp. NPDC059083]
MQFADIHMKSCRHSTMAAFATHNRWLHGHHGGEYRLLVGRRGTATLPTRAELRQQRLGQRPQLVRRPLDDPGRSDVEIGEVSGEASANVVREYIYLSEWEGTPFSAVYEQLRHVPSWRTHSLPTSHNVLA